MGEKLSEKLSGDDDDSAIGWARHFFKLFPYLFSFGLLTLSLGMTYVICGSFVLGNVNEDPSMLRLTLFYAAVLLSICAVLVCLHTEAAGGPGHHGALYPGAGLRGLRGETGALPTDERHAVPHVADERPAVPGVLLAGEALEEALGRRRGRLRPHKAATQRYRVGTTVHQVLQLFLLVQPPGAELGL